MDLSAASGQSGKQSDEQKASQKLKEVAAARAVAAVVENLVQQGVGLSEANAVSDAMMFLLVDKPDEAREALKNRVNGAEARLFEMLKNKIPVAS
jgi:hypothetical protein